MRAGTAAFPKLFLPLLYIAGFCNAGVAVAASYIHLPPCTLKRDPSSAFPLFSLCLEGNVSSWGEQRSRVENETQPAVLTSTSGRATALITSWLTLKVGGYARLYQDRNTGKTTEKDSRTDHVMIQLGNAATHRHRLFAGKAALPFGLNMDLNQEWSDLAKPRWYYGSPLRIAGYTYDNQKDITFTIAAGSADDVHAEAKRRRSASSVRFMYDLAALEGTRLIASFSADELEHRRASFAALNVNGRGDATGFEVIRTWSAFPFDPQDFNQLIRLSWSGTGKEWIIPKVQYEDELQQRRIGTLGAKFRLKKHFALSTIAGFCKDETGANRSYWLGVGGVEVAL